MVPLNYYLILSALLFSIGTAGVPSTVSRCTESVCEASPAETETVYVPLGTASSHELRTARPEGPAVDCQSMCMTPVSRGSVVDVPVRTRPFRVRSKGVVVPT